MSGTFTRCFTVVLILVGATFYFSEAQSSESSEGFYSEYEECGYSKGNGRNICVPRNLCASGEIRSNYAIITLKLGSPDECIDFDMVCCNMSELIRRTTNNTTTTTADTTEEDYLDWSGQCGERDVIGHTIGNETRRWKFPWSVGLFSTESLAGIEMEVFLCAGTLIDDQAVLTTAGCVHQQNKSNLRIHIGRWNINEEQKPFMQVIQVETVIVHGNYSSSSLGGNIALLFLKDSVITGRAANRVCLPDGQNFKTGSSCYVVGWWDNSAWFGPSRLVEMKAEPADRDKCTSSIQNRSRNTTYQLPEEHLCADYKGATVPCRLEGSSMVCALHENSKQFFLVGIASHIVGNCKSPGAIDVFENTQHYISWIDDVMTRNHRFPSYYRPDSAKSFEEY